MNNLRPFQIVLLTVSVFLMIAAVIFLATYKGKDKEVLVVPFPDGFTIWGTLEEGPFYAALNAAIEIDERFKKVSYRKFSEETFTQELVDAIAEDKGPDLIVLPHDQLVNLRDKLFPVSYEFYFKREFDAYVEGTDIFMRENGTYAIPFAVDPLVMYWNRDIFANSNVALPPSTWEMLRNDTVPSLTRQGSARTLLQSTVAFGEYDNVRNAGEVLSLLMIQSGSFMVIESKNGYQIVLDNSLTGSGTPAETSVSFYTEFSNPASGLYTWGRSLPEDRSHFLAGNLALYFGYGSEYEELARANPNLNFDMAPVPQGASAAVRRNYGRFYGFAIPRLTRDSGSSWAVAQVLGSELLAPELAKQFDMAPVDRVTLAEAEPDKYQAIRNESAHIARGWLSPDPVITDKAFADMINDITSGRLSIGKSITKAQQRLELGY